MLASIPENGEEFQLIADDYERFIIPGTSFDVIYTLSF